MQLTLNLPQILGLEEIPGAREDFARRLELATLAARLEALRLAPWATHVAMDQSGSWWAYSATPACHITVGIWDPENLQADKMHLDLVPPVEVGWMLTCAEVLGEIA